VIEDWIERLKMPERFQSLSGFLMRCDGYSTADDVMHPYGSFNPYRVF